MTSALDRSLPSRSLRATCALLALLVLGACRQEEEEPPPPTNIAPELGVDVSEMERTPSGLYIKVVKEGTGDPPRAGLRMGFQYKTWLVDGTVVDSTVPGIPQRATLGEDFLIDGFMEGIEGIRMGEERLLLIKPELGYGVDVAPGIPRNAGLVIRLQRVPPERTAG
jgi:hypothetical protein